MRKKLIPLWIVIVVMWLAIPVTSAQETNRILAYVVSPNGDWLAYGRYDGTLELYSFVEQSATVLQEGNGFPLMDIAWRSDSTQFVASDLTGNIVIWDVATATLVQSLQTIGTTNSRTISWRPQMDQIVVTIGERAPQVFDLTTSELIEQLQASDAADAAWSPDGSKLVTLGYGDIIRIWDGMTFSLVNDFQIGNLPVSLDWKPDSSLLAVLRINIPGTESRIMILDPANGNELQSYNNYQTWITSFAWSPDGLMIAFHDVAGQINVWEPEAGSTILNLQSNSWGVDWLPSGELIYGDPASEDGLTILDLSDLDITHKEANG